MTLRALRRLGQQTNASTQVYTPQPPLDVIMEEENSISENSQIEKETVVRFNRTRFICGLDNQSSTVFNNNSMGIRYQF